MRKIVFQSAVSLDGFIEGPNGELDWLIVEDASWNAVEFLRRYDTIFYGRKAYEKVGIPHVMDLTLSAPQRHFFDATGYMRKYVFSRLAKHVAGNGMVIPPNFEEEVKRIRAEDGKDIWLCGGAGILKAFSDLDLVDEYILSVYPVLLGSGKQLFGAQQPANLKLLNRWNMTSGVVTLQYRPQSRLKTQHHDH